MLGGGKNDAYSPELVKLLQEMAGATVVGPILTGVPEPIQICSTGSTVNDILNMAAIAAGRLGQVK